MNINGLAVLVGLLIIALGIFNNIRDDVRFYVTYLLIICGLVAIFIGLMADLKE